MDDPIACHKTADIQDLAGRPLTVMWERHKTISMLSAAAADAGFQLNIKARVDDALLILQNADLKHATGIVTGKLMSRFEGGSLHFIPFDDPKLSWNVYLISRRGDELSPAALVFSQYVRQHRNDLMVFDNNTV